MPKVGNGQPIWKFQNRRYGGEWQHTLQADWEIANDPISDDYTPSEITARDLFDMWADQVSAKYPDQLIPIYWFVESSTPGVFERMPFQFSHSESQPEKDFLTFYTWPIDSATDERLNWLTLPVADKLWNSKNARKGGFIQQATGWKPAILQPYVYLPGLQSVFQDA